MELLEHFTDFVDMSLAVKFAVNFPRYSLNTLLMTQWKINRVQNSP